MAGKRDGKAGYGAALRGSVGNNAAAFGFSIMITASFGVLQSIVGSPSSGTVFLFALGAVAGFVGVEVVASQGLSRAVSGDRPDVVTVGAPLSFFSVTLGVGSAALTATILQADVAFPLGGAVATATYLLAVGLEMLLGHEAEK